MVADYNTATKFIGANQTVTVDAELGAELIAGGYAEEVKPPKKSAKK